MHSFINFSVYFGNFPNLMKFPMNSGHVYSSKVQNKLQGRIKSPDDIAPELQYKSNDDIHKTKQLTEQKSEDTEEDEVIFEAFILDTWLGGGRVELSGSFRGHVGDNCAEFSPMQDVMLNAAIMREGINVLLQH